MKNKPDIKKDREHQDRGPSISKIIGPSMILILLFLFLGGALIIHQLANQIGELEKAVAEIKENVGEQKFFISELQKSQGDAGKISKLQEGLTKQGHSLKDINAKIAQQKHTLNAINKEKMQYLSSKISELEQQLIDQNSDIKNLDNKVKKNDRKPASTQSINKSLDDFKKTLEKSKRKLSTIKRSRPSIRTIKKRAWSPKTYQPPPLE